MGQNDGSGVRGAAAKVAKFTQDQWDKTGSWDPTREAWEEASFDKPSVVALDCSHIDDHLFVLGHMVPDAAGPWDRDETLILMLRPGSTHWEQLELPNHYDYGARITAVRIG